MSANQRINGTPLSHLSPITEINSLEINATPYTYENTDQCGPAEGLTMKGRARSADYAGQTDDPTKPDEPN